MKTKVAALAEHLRFQTPIPSPTEAQAEAQARDILAFLASWELKQLNEILGDEVQQAPVVYMTQEQRNEILFLLDQPCFTRPFKTKVLLNMPGFTEHIAQTQLLHLRSIHKAHGTNSAQD